MTRLRTLLEALDETPRTVTGLARELGWEEPEVERRLNEAQEEGLAVDWGELWATTWRAKLQLEPGFFRVWIPVSVAVGAGITGLAVALNGPPGTPGSVVPVSILVAVLATTWALATLTEKSG